MENELQQINKIYEIKKALTHELPIMIEQARENVLCHDEDWDIKTEKIGEEYVEQVIYKGCDVEEVISCLGKMFLAERNKIYNNTCAGVRELVRDMYVQQGMLQVYEVAQELLEDGDENFLKVYFFLSETF